LPKEQDLDLPLWRSAAASCPDGCGRTANSRATIFAVRIRNFISRVSGSTSLPGQLQPVGEVSGWEVDAPAQAEIDRILKATIRDPVGPEFMAPPASSVAA